MWVRPMQTRINIRRFFAYSVLGTWVGLTPIVVGTALQWSTQQDEALIALQQDQDINDAALKAPIPRTNTEALQLESQLKSALKATNSLGDKGINGLRAASMTANEFWWEFIPWTCLTLLASALFAERKERMGNQDTTQLR